MGLRILVVRRKGLRQEEGEGAKALERDALVKEFMLTAQRKSIDE